MIRKRVIISSIGFGLILAHLFAMNLSKASADNNFQYNLPARNPIDDIVTNPATNTPVNNINYNNFSPEVMVKQSVQQQPVTTNTPTQTSHYYNSNESYTYTVARPEWFEFCPFDYQNATFEEKKHWFSPHNCNRENNNYWYNRRISFLNALRTCDNRTGHQRDLCYAHLRSEQTALSNSWISCEQNDANIYAEWAAREERRQIMNRPVNVNVRHQYYRY